ncbi:MAG: ABC transporter ATP-binding protein [Leptolyngbya sp.]|nr:MAG: ABC transporter ATP-binding protein [Leptolyngbya sp.]
MSDSVIQVENLSKKYVLGQQQQGNSRYVALRDVVADGVRSFSHRLRHPLKPRVKPQQDEFWALKDVSFEVKQGDVVGIIGRNGAGKSTLLKILSRITEPTTGRVRLRGRVASLLEVGTGFHPELTGRENIFLNGAILGMSRVEITRKFDEIVEFAEVSRFLDTPVKRYSSGMYVRLAFAVAAHLEPEILVVDEVLAVGDAAFQKKCLGKMGDVAQQEGRTVLFVSHNMNSVAQLTKQCVFLRRGSIVNQGASEEIIKEYLLDLSDQGIGSDNFFEKDINHLDPSKEIEFLRIKVFNCQSKNELSVDIRYVVRDYVRSVLAARLESFYGTILATIRDTDLNPEAFQKEPGEYSAKFSLPINLLSPGNYSLTFSMADMMSTRYDFLEKVINFEVVKNESDLTPGWSREGFLSLNVNWETQKTA